MSKTTPFAIAQLDAGLSVPLWLGLFTADPGSLGGVASELMDANYVRQSITFTMGVNPASNTTAPTFPAFALDAGLVSHWGLIDSATLGAGQIRYRGLFETAIEVLAGQTATVAIGEIVITERTTIDA